MIPSRFLYTYPVQGDVVAFYHSLNIHTLFLAKDIADAVMSGNYTNEALIKTGMLVNSTESDDANIQAIRTKIQHYNPSLSVMYLLLTDECNLSCDYCFIENQLPSSQKRIFITKKTAKRAINFFAEALARHPEEWAKRKSIIFYGGEPLLNKSVFRTAVSYIIKLKAVGALPEHTRLTLITNGTLLTEELADFIKDTKVNVAVSLDGDQAATDNHRHTVLGESIFQDARDAIRKLQSRGINVGVSCTINDETLKDGQRTIDFIVEELGVKSVGFNILYRGHNIPLSDEYESRAASFIINAYERFRNEGVFENRMMRKVDAFIERRIYAYDCAAGGGRQVVVAPDGEIGICHGFLGSRKYFVGSVFDDGLIVENTPTYKQWKERSPFFKTDCESCPVLGICGGGCPCNAEISAGSPSARDERFCVHAKMSLHWLIQDLWRNVCTQRGLKISMESMTQNEA